MKQSLIARLVLVERALSPGAAWEHAEGLYSLLEVARHRPHREPGDEADDPDAPGLAGLLARARLALGHKEEEQ